MKSIFFKKICGTTLIFLLTACSTPRHQILGTTYGWENAEGNIKILLDAQVNKLRIRHVRMQSSECKSGYQEHLELAGEIGPDSTEAVALLLPKLHHCIRSDGQRMANSIFLSSGGGYLIDGFKLGELLRYHQVQTVVTGGQICASSCAIAFLGGKYRSMYHNAQLLFHSPYVRIGGVAIDCRDTGQVKLLQGYYNNMLGERQGAFLLDRTMSYCSSTAGWTLNADGARLFGILQP